MPIDQITPNQGYELPHSSNTFAHDVERLRAALNAIDVDMASLGAIVALKAALNSPAFTGTPTAPTAAPGDNSTKISTTAFVQQAVAALVASSPTTLNTLDELAAALGDDPNFATTITTLIGTKLNSSAYTAADVLAKLLTVDGAGTGLDADTVDGMQASNFVTVGTTQDITGLKTFTKNVVVGGPLVSTNVSIELGATGGGVATTPFIDFHCGAVPVDYDIRIIASGGTGALGGGTLDVQCVTFQWNGQNLVSESRAQTLTNKTLTSPVIDGNGAMIKSANPQIRFEDTDWTSGIGKYWWITHSLGIMTFFVDRDGGGVGDAPHPLQLNATTNKGYVFGGEILDAGSSQDITGLKTVKRGVAAPAAPYYVLNIEPTDFGTGKPRFFIQKETTAGTYQLGLWDGVNNNGTLQVSAQNINIAATTLTWGGASLVTTSGAQVIASKSFYDVNNYFVDDSDPTKRMRVECSGITTSTTRVLTIPDKDGTLALTDDVSMVKISTQVVSSAVAAVIFNNLPTGYSKFILRASNVKTSEAANSSQIIIQTSNDNGASFLTGSASYLDGVTNVNHLVYFNANGSTVTLHSTNTEVNLYGLKDAARLASATVTHNQRSNSSSAVYINIPYGGYARAALTIDDAFQLKCAGFNITEGTFTLYGVKE